MSPTRSTHGHTLLELASVLVVVGVALSLAGPAWTDLTDRAAAVAAREALASVVAEARLGAVGRGRVVVEVDARSAIVTVIAADTVVRAVDLAREFGVALALGGGGERAALSYDALGLGRWAGQTVHVRRGDAEATLVVSAYGRVRRP